MRNNENKAHILIVDDEPDILSLLEDILTRRNYTVYSADTVAKALKIIEEHPKISLVISDIKMPEGTGAELLKKIRSRDPVKPILVFLTALADLSMEDICERGASGYIEKPIDIKNFIKNVESILTDTQICKDLCETVPCTTEIKASLPSMSSVGIGNGGLFIPTKTPAKLKEIIRFNVTFENKEESLDGVGEVFWTRTDCGSLPQGIGIKFLHLSVKTQQIVRSIAKKNGVTAFIPRK
jgi:CheY-like chemotaxis protein/Tfp pilus assembly protein PilZ